MQACETLLRMSLCVGLHQFSLPWLDVCLKYTNLLKYQTEVYSILKNSTPLFDFETSCKCNALQERGLLFCHLTAQTDRSQREIGTETDRVREMGEKRTARERGREGREKEGVREREERGERGGRKGEERERESKGEREKGEKREKGREREGGGERKGREGEIGDRERERGGREGRERGERRERRERERANPRHPLPYQHMCRVRSSWNTGYLHNWHNCLNFTIQEKMAPVCKGTVYSARYVILRRRHTGWWSTKMPDGWSSGYIKM